VTDAKRYE